MFNLRTGMRLRVAPKQEVVTLVSRVRYEWTCLRKDGSSFTATTHWLRANARQLPKRKDK